MCRRFFGLPAGLRVWSQLGRKFWAGVLVGLGIGFQIAAVFVELELMGPHRKAWVSLTGVILFGLGLTTLPRATESKSQAREQARVAVPPTRFD
jgi:hypothetical protein